MAIKTNFNIDFSSLVQSQNSQMDALVLQTLQHKGVLEKSREY